MQDKARAYDRICERAPVRAVGADRYDWPAPKAEKLAAAVQTFIKDLPLGAEVTVQYERAQFHADGIYTLRLSMPVRGPNVIGCVESVSEQALELINDPGFLQSIVRNLFREALRAFV